jgi:hypothetical protein
MSYPDYVYFHQTGPAKYTGTPAGVGQIIYPGRPDSSYTIMRMIWKDMPQLIITLPDIDAIYMLWDWANELGGGTIPRPSITLDSMLTGMQKMKAPVPDMHQQLRKYRLFTASGRTQAVPSFVRLYTLKGRSIQSGPNRCSGILVLEAGEGAAGTVNQKK